ncbi:MAG: hypothetical protein Q9182_001365 [Xanthomendoza sp. 2 TL-2023]
MVKRTYEDEEPTSLQKTQYGSKTSESALFKRTKIGPIANASIPGTWQGTKQHFRFMDLPPEIRNFVYEYCLTVAGEIVPYPTIAERFDELMTPKYEKPAVALLGVSRKIGDEARPHLYGNNVWRISYQARPFLPTTVWDMNLCYFRHVTTSFDHRDITPEYLRAYCEKLAHRHSYRINAFSLARSTAVDLLYRVCEGKLKNIRLLMAFQNLVTIHLDFGHTFWYGTMDRSVMLKRIRRIEAFQEINRITAQSHSEFQRQNPARWLMQDLSTAQKGRSGALTCWVSGLTYVDWQHLFSPTE